MSRACTIGSAEAPVRIGAGHGLAIIAGPCVLESLELGRRVGHALAEACDAAGLTYVFKASFDKANRSSSGSPRGPGMEQGLDWLASIREELGRPATTDVHEPAQAVRVASAADLLQIPAFLARQTDLLDACAIAGKRVNDTGARHVGVNVKKGQFMAPDEMVGPLGKLLDSGLDNAMVTERGTFFGYGRLVNDFAGLDEMRRAPVGADREPWNGPVCFDCTHSTQRPGPAGGGAGVTAGDRSRSAPLARAAVAVGVDAVFMEAHPDPDNALSDAATQLPIDGAVALIRQLVALRTTLDGLG